MIRYQAFAKAFEMRSISKAAEILGYSRSKLSNIIGSLVDELGLRLLEEEDDLVVLTESGKKLIPYCQQIGGDIDVAFLTEEFAANTMFYPLFEDEICLAVNKNHPLAQQEALMAHDLRDVPIIYSPPGWDDITRIVINRLPFKPNIRCYSASDFVDACIESFK